MASTSAEAVLKALNGHRGRNDSETESSDAETNSSYSDVTSDEVSESSASSSGEECGEDEEDFFAAETKDIFSEKKFPNASQCVDFMKEAHGFDILATARRLDLDSYSFVKFVNFLRTKSKDLTPANVEDSLKPELWRSDDFLKPVLEDDGLLMLLMESEDNDGADEGEEAIDAKDLLKAKDDQIAALMEEMNKMRLSFHQILDLNKKSTRREIKTLDKEIADLDDQIEDLENKEIDDGYAEGYGQIDIHHEMLSDKVRTESYRKAVIENSKSTFQGKRVLDVGCGTGILSMFSATAGAAEVVGVDMSNMADKAKEIVAENGLEKVVSIRKGQLEKLKDLRDEGKKFDVILSEWMGYFLLYEGMLDSVIYARDNFLAEGGRVLPNKCTVHLAAVSDEEEYVRNVEFWDDVYGYSMKAMKSLMTEDVEIEVVKAEKLISKSVRVKELDIEKCSVADTEFEAKFDLEIEKTCRLTSILGYFDTFFDLPESPVSFSTGPQTTATHWKQTLLYLSKPLNVSQGQTLNCSIVVRKNEKDKRGLRISLFIDKENYEFTMH